MSATDWIADAERAGTELRALIREAHEATRDLRAVVKEWRDVLQHVPESVEAEVDKCITDQVAAGLKRYETSLDSAIKSAEAAVDKRFQTIADLLLGEDKRSRQTGKLSLADYALRMRDDV